MHEYRRFFGFRPFCPFRPVCSAEQFSAFYRQDGQEDKKNQPCGWFGDKALNDFGVKMCVPQSSSLPNESASESSDFADSTMPQFAQQSDGFPVLTKMPTTAPLNLQVSAE